MRRGGGLDALLLIVWCLILAGQGLGRYDLPGGGFSGVPEGTPHERRPAPGSPHGARSLHPRFTPVAVLVPPIGSPPVGPVSLPATPNLPGAFGQTSGAFAPPPPTGLSVGPPAVLLIPQTPLGQGSGAFAPSAPTGLQFVPLAGNAPQTQGGIPYFVPFAMGPTSIINQFVQPPLVPFGQVGVPVQPYLPGFFTGNANPFNRSCNYYYFAGCGPSGGAVTDFNFSTR
ncbi:MAG: hypothetical protein D084_Lepto4C00408G0006 [Leptospirillum sp. Group IV 'UBA BS']|nr:MAG: hypothetical protein D084_Lepto4C00408G0006 [Leptospirillum sp. Group IV 'UBA BS']MCL5284602.1 hypothetical protein [Nitrospirota bacterium]